MGTRVAKNIMGVAGMSAKEEKIMSRRASRARHVGVGLLLLAVLGTAFGFAVAQSTVVTQAEWGVYMTQALRLDWNLPANPRSEDYLARLDWSNSIEFAASHMLDGSTARAAADGAVEGVPGVPAEALYEVATLRPGDYTFRVKMGGGNAILKISEHEYELYQPDATSRWMDLDRVSLDSGAQPMSLMLIDGTRVETLGVTPPCMLPVEPSGGWRPLDTLIYGDMAETLARALDLEKKLPEIGEPLRIRGEEFRRTFVYPYEEAGEPVDVSVTIAAGEDDQFWLSAGPNIVSAVARFEVSEKGIYSIEARYFSSTPLRWNIDRCLRVVTCPLVPDQSGGNRRSLALELDAGEHEIEVTLPPGGKLDRIEVQRRDNSSEAYLSVVSDEGFKLGDADEPVRRREAIRAARRLADRFDALKGTQCRDELIAMENVAHAGARRAAASSSSEASTNPNASPSSPQFPASAILLPPDVAPIDTASPVETLP